MYIIYLHKNIINGKVYIGQTMQSNPNLRWKNGKGYKNNPHFTNAINKYGWDNFEHTILEQGDWSLEEANQKEDYYINLYDSRNPEKGYNINAGGNKEISKQALENALLWMQEHPNFGLERAQDMLKWQQEHPEEILAMRKINIQKATNARKKAVLCIETNKIYESASEAARQNPNTTQSKICMVCRGQRKTCGGYHWKYVEE